MAVTSISLQTVPGLCTKGRRCVKKDGHKKPCWPTDGPTSSSFGGVTAAEATRALTQVVNTGQV